MWLLALPLTSFICLIYALFTFKRNLNNLLPFIMVIASGFIFSLIEVYIIYNIKGFNNDFFFSKIVFLILIMILNGTNIILKSQSLKKNFEKNNFDNLIKNNFLYDCLLLVSAVLFIMILK